MGGELRGGEVEGSDADGVQRCGGLAAEAVGVTGKGFFGTARGKTGGDDDDAAHPLGVTDFFTQGKDGAHDAAVVKLYHVEVEHSLFARQIDAAGGKSLHDHRGEAVRTLRFFTSGASGSLRGISKRLSGGRAGFAGSGGSPFRDPENFSDCPDPL